MTKISLRVYNHEIEGMIESGQVDEAIAHCQHILKTFPMHLETYRLLGKAFLETRRYGDAADIFQRVLMSVPEDFVSHVGMSIIRDDESKLDEAIWHMERAFEVQPSNPAIQDELRKLYGRRDGVQPPKVRLTRDALANMYAQGALYSQAIAEIRAVLVDDPNRPDLQVMLARAYSKDGRKKQAIEICTELLKKYPYCFDALRILIDLLPPSDTNEYTQTYRLRVRALDPYAEFTISSIFSSDNVPDAAVNLELLDYDPNDKESSTQPAWASSLGVRIEPDNEQKDVPEWLSEKKNDVLPVSEEEIQQHATIEEKDMTPEIGDVPEWMRSSGWEKSTEQVDENSGFDEIENEEPLAKAEIPEWLKEMAPSESEAQEPDKKADGFESLFDGSGIDQLSQDVTNDLEQDPDVHESMNEKVVSEGEIQEFLKGDEINGSDQLANAPSLETQISEQYQDGIDTISSEDFPKESNEPISKSADDIPSWLGEDKEDTVNSGIKLSELGNTEDDLPEWLNDIGSEKEADHVENLNEFSDEIPSQTESNINNEQQVEPEFRTTKEEDLPEWLKDVGSNLEIGNLDQTNESITENQIPSEEDPSELDPVASDMEVTPNDDLPDWLKEIGSEESASIAEVSKGSISDLREQSDGYPTTGDQIGVDDNIPDENDLPDWLNEIDPRPELKTVDDEISATFGVGEAISSIIEEKIVTPDLPEAMPVHDGIVIEDDQVAPNVEPTLEVNSVEERLPSIAEQDAAMAWLESLATNQGAKPEDLLTKPEDRSDEPPEWVKNSIENESKSSNEDTVISKSSDLGIQASSQEDEISSEHENQHDGFILDKDQVEINKLDLDSSEHKDDPNWLKDFDGIEQDNLQDLITPKVSEYYGDEISEPLPDWLKDIEKGSSSPEWITEADGSSEQLKDISDPMPISNENDIEDIGEIFPDEATHWDFEGSETELVLEPIDEVVKPVTSGDWQPIQPEQKEPDVESSEYPKTVAAIQPNGSAIRGKPAGTGMLSKIPPKEIEKEAITLEQAQSFIEKGEINKAIEAYSRLVRKGQLLEGVIHDLRETTYRYPVDIGIWQLLGDAYMRQNQLQDALDAYTKAEELLR